MVSRQWVTADIIEAAMELAIDTARHATAPFGAALLDVTTLRAFSGGNTYFESGIASLTPKPTFYGPQ